MLKKKILFSLTSLMLALSLNKTYALTTGRDSHVNNNLTNYIGIKEYRAEFYGWHSSAASFRDSWTFRYTNEDFSGNLGTYTISNGNIKSFFTGSKAFDNTMVIYYNLPEQVVKFINTYGVENIGMKIKVGNVDCTKDNKVSYSMYNNQLRLEFTPVFNTTNTTLWQGTNAWNSMNTYGKINIPTVKSGYGTNYLSATFSGITGNSIIVDNNVLSSAYKNYSGGMSFNSSEKVLTSIGTSVPLNTVSVGATVWGGGSHGVFFYYPMTMEFYDTTIHSKNITVSDAEYFDGSTYWVKANDNFKATISAYTKDSSDVVKVNSQHLKVTSNGEATYIDARLHSNQTSISKWSNFSTIDFNESLSSGSRSSKTLTTNYVVSLSGDKDISLKGLSRLVQHSTDFATEKVYREVYSDNEVYVKSDSSGPTITFPTKPTWITSTDSVKISVSDSRSGVASFSVRYRINNGEWSQASSSDTVNLSSDGIYEIEVVAKDNVGNETTKTKTYKVDKTAPAVTLKKSPTAWTNGDITVTATITETGSGINTRKWASGSQSASYFANGGTTITTNSFPVTTNGMYTFYVKDNAGHETVKTISITNIDKTAPTITLSQSTTAWTKDDVTVTAKITENASGIKTKKWASGNRAESYFASGGTTITTNSFEATANGTYTFYVKDSAGNETVKTINITNIDKTAPTITLSQNPTAWTKGNVTVTAKITENGSGVNIKKWASGNQTASYFASGGTTITGDTFTATANGTYTFYVKDNVGNESVKTINITNIDKTAPTITLSQSPTAWTNGNVTVTAKITESGSGVNVKKWASGNQAVSYFASGGTTITGDTFTATANGTYTFYVKDNVGNETVKTITISNIDKKAPTIALSQNPTTWTKGNVTVTATITETDSGINTRKWASGNQSVSYFASAGTTITANNFTATANGIYTFYVKDNAGNETVKTINITNIDKVAPVITLSQNPTAWTKGNVTVTATITENGSGINTRKWASGNQSVSYFASAGTTITTNNFTATANGIYTFYVKDNAGNESVKTINITNIDKTAPTITLSQSPTAWTKGNVTVTATITENGSGINTRKWASGNQPVSYFASGGTTITSNSFTATANGTYTFYVKDNVGNESVKTINITNIDKTAPAITLSQSPTAWTKGNVTVTATITETGSGVSVRKWASGNQSVSYFASGGTTITTNSFAATANGTYTFYVKDNAGNETVKTINITNIDKVAPVITLSQSPTAWTKGNVTVTATITENGSGINTRKWASGNQSVSYFASAGTTITTNNFTATANGIYTFYVKDNAGNESVKTINITNIDKTAPTIVLSQSPTAWTKGNVTVTATITENGSGINTRKWASGNQAVSYFASGGTTITANNFTATANGIYTFYVKDNAGNETVKTINITNIDKVAPVITLSQNPTAWTKGNVTVTAKITENGSGINTRKWASGNQSVSYFASGGTTITTNSFAATANGTYTFYVKDNAGNETVKTISITNIDKTAPTITLSQNPTAWTKGNVTVTATITENGSGVNVKKWASGNQTANYFASGGTTITGDTFTATANGTYTFYVKDNAGNETVKTINITNIDKVAPAITLSQNPTAWTKGNVTVTATITENGSGINTRKWASGSQSVSYFASSGTTITTNNFTATTNGTYTFYVKDNVGNESVKTINITNIDKTAPTIVLSQNPTTWTKDNVTVTAKITETGSGVSVKKWASGSQSVSYFASGGTTITTDTFTATANGTYTFYVKDNVGNESIKTINITNIDKVVPAITLKQNPTTWTNGNVTVTATITENGSGINTKKWASGNQSISYFASAGTSLSSNSFTATANGTYTFYVKDNAGNESVKTINITNIDKTAPTIALSQNPTAWTNGNVTVTATITENGSGVNTRKWASGSQSASYFASAGTSLSSNSFTVTTNGTYTFYVKDNAGNTSIKTIVVTNIDKVLPTITGTFDYPWVKGTRTVLYSSNDNDSGVYSLKLWNSDKTTVLKNGTINGKTASLAYTVSQDGITKYKIESTDIAKNVTIKDVTVKIDNTAPKATISVPTITNDKTFKISFSNVIDIHSGIKEALISENSSFTGNNVVNFNLTDVSSLNGTKSTYFTLSAKTTVEAHFSTRTVYIRLFDNVGNYTDYKYNIKLIPKNPDIPKILTPTEDQLYTGAERIVLSWSYNSQDEDLGYLPQEKAEIELKHVDTGKIKNFEILGENFEKTLIELEDGDYEVKVRVYSFSNTYSESSIRKFRINSYKGSGNVLTVDIKPGSPIRYVSILTKSAVPKGTSLSGKIYYSVDSKDNISKDKYVPFEIRNTHQLDNIIKLPQSTKKIRVEYFLKGSASNKFITPELDHVVILAK